MDNDEDDDGDDDDDDEHDDGGEDDDDDDDEKSTWDLQSGHTEASWTSVCRLDLLEARITS